MRETIYFKDKQEMYMMFIHQILPMIDEETRLACQGRKQSELWRMVRYEVIARLMNEEKIPRLMLEEDIIKKD